MKIKSCFAILIGLFVIHSCRCQYPEVRQMPQPDLTSLRDDVGTLPVADYYLPAVMQALHYYTEMMQYEQVVNPAMQTTTNRPVTTRRTTTTRRPTTTTTTTRRTTTTTKPRPTTTSTTTTPRPTTTTTTTTTSTTRRPTRTKRPTTTQQPTTSSSIEYPYFTEINIWLDQPSTPRPHKPGNYAPEKPPYWSYDFGIQIKPEQEMQRPGGQRPQQGISTISDPSWNDPTFIQWFFQSKPRDIETFDENELQYLDPLPKRLLLDIHRESNQPPALLDLDNVNEFRKKYDDSFYPRYRNNVPNMQHMRMKMKLQMQQKRPMLTGRKKPPPTRPYVHMLMLYDLLKREAKSKKLQQFGGYTPELLKILNESSQHTGDYQMKFLLEEMLNRKEVSAADVLSRVNFIITDLNNEKSDTFKTLRSIPPLSFAL